MSLPRRDKETKKSRGFAFLAYEDQRSTVLAVDNLNGIKVDGRTVRVEHVLDYRKKREEASGNFACAVTPPWRAASLLLSWCRFELTGSRGILHPQMGDAMAEGEVTADELRALGGNQGPQGAPGEPRGSQKESEATRGSRRVRGWAPAASLSRGIRVWATHRRRRSQGKFSLLPPPLSLAARGPQEAAFLSVGRAACLVS